MMHGMIGNAKFYSRTKSTLKSQKRKQLRRSLVVQNLEKRTVLDGTYFPLAGGNFSQDWSDPGLITTNDVWSGVPSIIGYRGDNLSNSTATDPQTVLAPSTVVNVVAQSLSTATGGGVHEIEASGTIAIQGSGTADAPHIVLHLDTTGRQNVVVSYDLIELDASVVNQRFALQYRVGNSGNFTNLPGGAGNFFVDPGNQTQSISVALPAAAFNVPQVEVRIITNDTVGADAMVGIDNIVVTSSPAGDLPPSVLITPISPNPRTTAVPSIAIVFNEPVQNFDLSDLSLTRDGGPNLLTGSQTLTTLDNTTFTLSNLSGITSIDGTYTLALSVSNIQDLTLNALSAGDSESWTMDASGPTVTQLTPLDNANDVFPEDNLVIAFNESVAKGTGNITVHLQSDNSVVATIDVTSTAVTVVGNTVTINPAANLPLSTGLYVNVPATAFVDTLLNPFVGITGTTAWNFSTSGVSSVIAEQNFNGLTVQTANVDTVTNGSPLTNAGSFNTGGPQLDFTTSWFATRGNTTGPVLGGADTQDFIGVNSFAGAFAPGVSANGTAVGVGETNFEINDADGEIRIVFEPMNLAGFSARFLSFNYWINATDFEVGDIFRATISDGTNSTNFIDLDSVAMNANESLDNGTANWRTASVNLENLIDNLGYGTTMTLTISVSNTDDTGADNVFIDNVLVRGTADLLAPDIEVRGNGIAIVSGDTTPSVTDATSFGTAILNSAATTTTFTIANTGNAPLILSGSPLVSITGSSNFAVSTQPTNLVGEGGGTTTFVVTFTPTTLGLQTATISILGNDSDESPYTFNVSGTVSTPPPAIFINEVDSDTTGTDVAEFIELYDGGVGNTSLTGLVVVLYNGAGDISYNAFDLDGFSTDASGYFLLRNTAIGAGGLVIPDGALQNGADAVAIYLGDAVSFPNNTPLTLTNLIDAVVYDTADADDTGLLTLITAGGQIDETGTSTAEANSIARVPNGGVLRNASNFVAQAPTPGTSNALVVTPTITATPLTKVYDGLDFSITATADDGPAGFAADSTPTNFTYTFYAGPGLTGGVIAAPRNVGSYSVDVAYLGSTNYNAVASTAFNFTITPKALTVTAVANNKVFDGTTAATITYSNLAGFVGSETVTVSSPGSGTFASSAVGTNIAVTANAPILVNGTGGGLATNYSLATPVGLTANITAPVASITTRAIFYNNSPGFGTSGVNNSPSVNPSSAIDTTKSALQTPGAGSTFANYTNYSRGLNGLIIDVNNLPGTTTNAQLLASLQLAQWNGIAAGGFGDLPVTAVPTVSILPGVGTGGSARVRITFPDNTLQNTWLRVTVLANAETNLVSNDVFYFGNVIGELNFANTATRLRVNGQDTNLILGNQSPGANSVDITSVFDVNRDRRVNGQDTNVLLTNQQAGGIVAPITVPLSSVASRSIKLAAPLLSSPNLTSTTIAPSGTSQPVEVTRPPSSSPEFASQSAPVNNQATKTERVRASSRSVAQPKTDSIALESVDRYFAVLGSRL